MSDDWKKGLQKAGAVMVREIDKLDKLSKEKKETLDGSQFRVLSDAIRTFGALLLDQAKIDLMTRKTAAARPGVVGDVNDRELEEEELLGMAEELLQSKKMVRVK
jgi:hypothetical protein